MEEKDEKSYVISRNEFAKSFFAICFLQFRTVNRAPNSGAERYYATPRFYLASILETFL